MKKIFTLLLLISAITYSNAQHITDIFYLIPAEYVDNLNHQERQQLIRDAAMEKDDIAYSVSVDAENRYLLMEFGFTEGQSGYGMYELASWDLPDHKLIALSVRHGSNGGFFQSDFKFFTLKDNTLSLSKPNVFKGYSSDFETTMSNVLTSFVVPGLTAAQKEALIYGEFTIALAQEGTDIVIGFSEEAAERNMDQLTKTEDHYYFDPLLGTFHYRGQ